MMSQKAFHTWLNQAKKGDKISYYRGYLCYPYLQPIDPGADVDRIKKFAKAVYGSAEIGLIALVQKRHQDFDYEYIAVRK
jgi:hypothetical protein|tara:strand:+ start:59 stop:298 length:240 start_codon:yes stop_codon:yes gene_type:complete